MINMYSFIFTDETFFTLNQLRLGTSRRHYNICSGSPAYQLSNINNDTKELISLDRRLRSELRRKISV